MRDGRQRLERTVDVMLLHRQGEMRVVEVGQLAVDEIAMAGAQRDAAKLEPVILIRSRKCIEHRRDELGFRWWNRRDRAQRIVRRKQIRFIERFDRPQRDHAAQARIVQGALR